MKFGSLFTGIGGMDLGLERAGFQCAFQVEIHPFCQQVLAKHWPSVPRHTDIRTLQGADLPPVDLLCGGFPCQDISIAGRGKGLTGEHSGLWFEYARLIAELRPHYVLIENSTSLRSRGLDRVLGQLAALGFDAEWHCIPASAVGAPHQRDRIWIVAYAHDAGRGEHGRTQSISARYAAPQCPRPIISDRSGYLADSSGDPARGIGSQGGAWEAEPRVGRVVDGVPRRVDRLRALGNACVPQVVEWLGKRILEFDEVRLLTEFSAAST